MAKEAVAEAEVMDGEEGAAEAAPKSGKKKLIIIVAAVLLAAGGAGAFFMLRGGKAEHAKSEKKIVLPLQFYAMDPAFVVNFEASSVSRFLQIEVRVGTREPIELASGSRAGHGGRRATPSAARRRLVVRPALQPATLAVGGFAGARQALPGKLAGAGRVAA